MLEGRVTVNGATYNPALGRDAKLNDVVLRGPVKVTGVHTMFTIDPATLGLQLDLIEVRKAEDVPGAIAAAKAGGSEALYIGGDPILNSPTSRVSELAAQAGLPLR